MGIKLVVCDMDGTLFFRDEIMPPFVASFSQRLSEKNVMFTVATGRSLPLSRKFTDVLKPTAPCVYANGALISSEESIVEAHRISLLPLKEILDDALSMGISVLVNWDEKEDFVFKHTPWTREQNECFGVYQTEHYPTDEEWRSHGAYKLMLKDKSRRIWRITDQLVQLPEACSFVRYEDGACEIMAVGLTKAKGVLRLATALGVDRNEVLAIGDYYNDIEMMSAVGQSAAVGNAIDAVKENATFVCTQKAAYGVREAIEAFCL